MKGFSLTISAFILSVLLLTSLLFGLTWFGLGWRYFWAEPRGRVEAQQIIQSAPVRIGAYNQFFDACASVQGLDASLDTQTDLLSQTTDTKEQTRIRANIAGITAERMRAVTKYNTDARKDYTIGQFRDSQLPYRLPLQYKRGEVVSCGNE